MLQSWRQAGNALWLQLKGSSAPIKLSALWLLDSQDSNWHAQTQQKINPASTLPVRVPDVAEVTLKKDDDGVDKVEVRWAGNALPTSTVSLGASAASTASASVVRSNRHGLPAKRPWAKLDHPLPSSDYSSSSPSPSQQAATMLSNLAVFGVHLVRNMPNTMADTESFIRANFGPPRETLYGSMWDTAPRSMKDMNDTAYTYDALDPHTDCCYLIDSPGLQCFNCVAQDQGGGGFTRLVDSEYVLQDLRQNHASTFSYFAQRKLAFHHTEQGLHALHYAPVIQLEDGDVVRQFRYNEYDLARFPSSHADDAESLDAFYAHNRVLVACIKRHEFHIKLGLGDMIVIDNHRVLHGRTAFTGFRNLIGCYVGADDWMMRARAVL